MEARSDDLDLLLSLRDDRVIETPPASPSNNLTGSIPDDLSPRAAFRSVDMSVFRDAVKDYLDVQPSFTATVKCESRGADDVVVEKFSGLRIKNSLISSAELGNRFSDVRFVRLQTIKNLLVGDTLSGCWATVGVLIEKGASKLSSTGKNYCICKMGSLDGSDVSIFLFGDAYTMNSQASVGTVFALFNATVRKNTGANGFSLTVYSVGQMIKMGTSADYGICKGKRKDGLSCTMVINRRKGAFCKFHTSKASQTYSTMRAELKGGNLRTAFKRQLEGIYAVDPLADRSSAKKPLQRVKVMSVEGLKKALSKADKITTNSHSQGIRFLSQVTANKDSSIISLASFKGHHSKGNADKRSFSAKELTSQVAKESEQPQAKRNKTIHLPEKMIELDIISSDEEY